MQRVLVCDDDSAFRGAIRVHLEDAGFAVSESPDGETAVSQIAAAPPDALVLDLRMPRVDGLEVLRRLGAQTRTVPTIVITAHGGVDSAMQATRLGAAAFLCKPFEPSDLLLQLELVMKDAPRQIGGTHYERLVGGSARMQELFSTLRRLERIDAPTVLVVGESGTGKDLVAQAIHARGPRRDKPFMAIDCAAMPETLIESELFGHERGAFTDAQKMKRGLFEIAKGGVIFLDEIGEMAPATQAKLLRALENRKFKRVGGVQDIALDAAIIAATNRNLREEMKRGRFREDLFFRLNVVPLQIPALRERREDIALLAQHLIEHTCRDLGRRPHHIAEDALLTLASYDWPGNVRELRNVVERAVILKGDGDVIALADLPDDVRGGAATAAPAPGPTRGFELPPEGVDLESVERSLVEQAIARAGGNRTHAAKLLGISRFALRYRLEKYRSTTQN